MPSREFDEQRFGQLVRKVLSQFDGGLISGEEAVAGIVEGCAIAAGPRSLAPPQLEWARTVLDSCTRVVDEEVGSRAFGDDARRAAASTLWVDLMERPRSWDAFRRRCMEARELLQSDRQAALRRLLAVARSGDPEVGMLDDRQTLELVRLATTEDLPELIAMTMPPQAGVGHGRVAWEDARRRLAERERTSIRDS